MGSFYLKQQWNKFEHIWSKVSSNVGFTIYDICKNSSVYLVALTLNLDLDDDILQEIFR